ncbi:hypothetical protein BASA81_011005 [Batrachochytrium salamandrivorans]|nr:hypothetical protein BASA81_011005 [Batrachochytrium salamandrivorans]
MSPWVPQSASSWRTKGRRKRLRITRWKPLLLPSPLRSAAPSSKPVAAAPQARFNGPQARCDCFQANHSANTTLCGQTVPHPPRPVPGLREQVWQHLPRAQTRHPPPPPPST